jgi:hypothetical protein
LENQLNAWKQLPEFSGLTGDDLINALRKVAKIPVEQLVVGVIASEIQVLLGSSSQALLLSADTVVKQLINRAGQSIDADTYLNLQGVLDGAQVVKSIDGNKVAYWHKDGKIWFAVIKTTREGAENYLLSLRSSNVQDAKRMLTADELFRLGVA